MTSFNNNAFIIAHYVYDIIKNMGIMVNKDEEKNSRLTDRINADLREKMSETSKIATDPDLAEDSEYVKDMKKTSKFGWVWIVLIVLAIISLVVILI